MITTTATLISKEDSPDGQTSFLQFEVEERFDFAEGQFVMIDRPGVVDIEGRSVRRAYSIGTTARQMREDGVVGTIVKQASTHGLSAYLTQEIQIGDRVSMIGAVGHLVDEQHHGHYLLIATGSGITPIYSIAQQLWTSGEYERLALLYGERYTTQLVPSIQQQLEETRPDYWSGLYLSQAEQLPDGWRSGRITAGWEEALHYLGTDDLTVIICGQPLMVDEMRERLIDHGIDPTSIKYEKY